MSVYDVTSVLQREKNVLISKFNFELYVFAFYLCINAYKYTNNYN